MLVVVDKEEKVLYILEGLYIKYVIFIIYYMLYFINNISNSYGVYVFFFYNY